MNRIRAFIAADLSVETVTRVMELQARLRPKAKQSGMKIAWVPAPNLHVTLKFLAEIPEEGAWVIRDLLRDRLAGRPSMKLVVKGAGAFPSRSKPRVLWVGVHSDGEALVGLAREVDDWLVELGFPKETRPFHPHLTLGRVKEGAGDVIEGEEDTELGSCVLKEVVLYKSVLNQQGAEYTPLSRFPLNP